MQKFVIAGLGILCSVLIVILVIGTLAADKEGPNIEYTTSKFTYTEGMDTKELLLDVTAKDAKDGDVSYSLIIENIVKLDEVNSAVVIYVAKDESNNITKKERIIDYRIKDEEVNKSQLEESQIEEESTQSENENQMSMGDVFNTYTKEKALAAGNPYLELTTTEDTLKKGDTFNYANYIKEAVDDKDNVYGKVRVSKTYDMNKTGEYKVEFYVVDSEGNTSNKEILTLTVED